MALLHIKEIFNEQQRITLKVDGRLDDSSIPALDDICKRHLRDGRQVYIVLEGLYHINREGRKYLKSINKKVILEKIPEFIQLNDTNSD